MIRSKIILLSNHFHFFALLFALIGLTFTSSYFLIVLIPYIIYLFHLRLITVKTIIIIIIFLLVFYILVNLSYSMSNSFKGTIIEIDKKDDYTVFVIQHRFKKVLVYYYGEESYKIGDVVSFTTTFRKLNNTSYDLYYKSKQIYYTSSTSHLNLEGSTFCLSIIRDKILSFYNIRLNNRSYNFLSSLVFSKEEFDEEFTNSVNSIGISYLFCISGFHITILTSLMEKIISKFPRLYQKRDYIIIPFLLFYLILCNFPYGVLRAVLMYIITRVNFNKQLNLSKLDICSISFLLIIFMNPLSIYSLSFKLTFIVSFFIVLGSYLINDKNKVKQAYKMSIVAFLATIPLISSLMYQINLVTIIISPLFLFIFSTVIMPLTYILVLIPQLYPIIDIFFNLFENLVYLIDQINILKISIASYNPILTIFYYISLGLVYIKLETKKINLFHIALFLSIFIVSTNQPSFDPIDKVIVFDVGQGDSMLIKLAHNNGNILIDSYNTNIKKIKALGVKNLDAMIITHSDDDHIETAKEALNTFNCETLISSFYDKANTIEELRKEALNNYLAKAKDTINIKSLKLDFLGPNENLASVNNISLVFTLKINNTSFLFTGDMEKDEELNIIKDVNKINVDILKVPHHGSNSSLSFEFMNIINFKTAIISVGLNNKYKHPSEETLVKLKNYKVYRTDLYGDIYVYIYNKTYKIKYNLSKSII